MKAVYLDRVAEEETGIMIVPHVPLSLPLQQSMTEGQTHIHLQGDPSHATANQTGDLFEHGSIRLVGGAGSATCLLIVVDSI